jgi:hypothetical protein
MVTRTILWDEESVDEVYDAIRAHVVRRRHHCLPVYNERIFGIALQVQMFLVICSICLHSPARDDARTNNIVHHVVLCYLCVD